MSFRIDKENKKWLVYWIKMFMGKSYFPALTQIMLRKIKINYFMKDMNSNQKYKILKSMARACNAVTQVIILV